MALRSIEACQHLKAPNTERRQEEGASRVLWYCLLLLSMLLSLLLSLQGEIGGHEQTREPVLWQNQKGGEPPTRRCRITGVTDGR